MIRIIAMERVLSECFTRYVV